MCSASKRLSVIFKYKCSFKIRCVNTLGYCVNVCAPIAMLHLFFFAVFLNIMCTIDLNVIFFLLSPLISLGLLLHLCILR